MTENIKSEWQKIVSNQLAFVESAIGELAKLEAKAVAQVSTGFEEVGRYAKESLAYAERFGAEWRKQALEATKRAAEILTPKQ
jgi:hypothetical protein